MQATQHTNMWKAELDDLVRGACGGFLLGTPLLYTMEVWWIGSYAEPQRLLVALATTFFAVLLLNRTAGFRQTKDIRLVDAAMDSVEALAIGILCTTFVLVLIREITLQTSLGESIGKIIFESVPFTIGVALARQFLSGSRGEASDSQDEQSDQQHGGKANGERKERINATLADLGATVIGSLIIGLNIAPTEEIPMLAAAISPLWLLLIIAASLLISYGIVFEAGFANEEKRKQQQGLFQRPLSETIASYLVALVAAAFMLWFFHQLNFDDPWTLWLNYSLIFALPASVGGAAGRLAV